MPNEKTARWLDLLAFLLSHRYAVTREQIFQRVRGYTGKPESARRTFERDKDELRALGIHIQNVDLPDAAGDEPATGYRLSAPGFYLPYFELTRAGERAPRPYSGLRQVSLTDDELAALDRATRKLASLTSTPFATAAAGARRKLAFDLPLVADAAERILEVPLPEPGREALEVLQRAVVDRRAVECRYYTISRDALEPRVIEPYGLFFQWGHWYCAARARDRNAVRVFRVDRMRDAKRLDQESFEVPKAFDIAGYIGRAPWELGSGAVTPARVRFDFPVSRWVVNQRAGRVLEAETEDGSAVCEFDVRDRGAFVRWLLSFRGEASLLEPADLSDDLRLLRERVAALYPDVAEADA